MNRNNSKVGSMIFIFPGMLRGEVSYRQLEKCYDSFSYM